ncbi:MAG: hypothetical protein IKP30_09175 [Bacteroidaceae bacterium]|nr:hypothetical protein [Bacteroidaceae bacterium]
MAKIDPNWLLSAVHGRADKKSGLYLRRNFKTGAVYAVQRNPERTPRSTPNQLKARERFRLISKGSTEFVRQGREAAEAPSPSPLGSAFLKVQAEFNAQSETAFLRSYVMKHYAAIADEGRMTVTVGDFVFSYEQ